MENVKQKPVLPAQSGGINQFISGASCHRVPIVKPVAVLWGEGGEGGLNSRDRISIGKTQYC